MRSKNVRKPPFDYLAVLLVPIALGGLVFRKIVSRLSLKSLAVAVLLTELGGIWYQLACMRREQVKNSVYALYPDVRAKMQSTEEGREQLRMMTAQANVSMDPLVGGQLRVQVSQWPDDPVTVEAKYPLPVAIRH